MKRHFKQIRIFSLSLVVGATLLLTGCPKGDLAGRAARAVGAIPGVVRILFPNAEKAALDDLDLAVSAFNAFINDKTSDKWQKALNLWNDTAKPRLLKFNSTRLSQIVAVTDILLSQVIVPTGSMESVGDEPIVVKFSEVDVKRLEELVK